LLRLFVLICNFPFSCNVTPCHCWQRKVETICGMFRRHRSNVKCVCSLY